MDERPRRAAITGDEDLLRQIIEAATEGSVDLLDDIMKEDRRILDKVVLGFLSKNPLHTAAWYGHIGFVKKLLQLNPTLARLSDSMDRTALHLASTQGHVAVVEVLIEKTPEMCLARDRDGRNPVHDAAMNRHVDVLKVLIEASRHAARARLHRDETILHLCVKLNRFESLKVLLEMIHDEEFVNAKDSEGNTILHLAVIGEHVEIIKHLVDKYVITKRVINVKARNACERTAKDLLPESSEKMKSCEHTAKDVLPASSKKMRFYLELANARTGKNIVQDEWISKNRDGLMVVISLIATITFQAGVSPPGGGWQDNSNGHIAGESIMASKFPTSYKYYICFSTSGFLTSLTTLVLLVSGFSIKNVYRRWLVLALMISTISFVVASYAISVFWVTPRTHWRTLTDFTSPVILVFFLAIIFLLLRIYYLMIVPATRRFIRRFYSKAAVSVDANIQGVEVRPSERPNSDSITRRPTNV